MDADEPPEDSVVGYFTLRCTKTTPPTPYVMRVEDLP